LGNFTVTIYNIALESDYAGKKTEQPKNLSQCYSSEFLNGIKMQGTGKDDNGKYIRWDGAKGYNYTDGAITASGRKAVSGLTIAVDPKVIPLGSLVYIKDMQMTFRADDTGGAIKGNHIDLFFEVSRKDALAWGTKTLEIFEVITRVVPNPATQPTTQPTN
jgi:3D (Asp-Asp-Asp) domain-containing protein